MVIIIVSLFIIPLLAVFNFSYLGSLGKVFDFSNFNGDNSAAGVSGLIDQGQQSQVKANLKAVFAALEAYYAESGSYPTSLAELDTHLSGTDTSNIVYAWCSSSSAILHHNSENYPGYILDRTLPKPTSITPPNC